MHVEEWLSHDGVTLLLNRGRLGTEEGAQGRKGNGGRRKEESAGKRKGSESVGQGRPGVVCIRNV